MKEQILELYNTKKNYYTKYIKQDKKMIKFLNNSFRWTKDIKEQVYCLKNIIIKRPMCKYKGCRKAANFKGQTEGYGVGCCSRKHGIAVSNLEKYGYEFQLQNKGILTKTKESLKAKHGVDNPMKSKKIASKVSKTRKNYSDEQKQQYLDRRSETNLEKYGVKNIFEKVEYIGDKVEDKYGVRNIAQVPEFQDKRDATVKSKMKEYLWATGEITNLQGYEPIVLKELEEAGYKYKEVLTKKSDMPEVWYTDDKNIKHRYYADFYIPTKNIVIEVKSEYTMLSNFYINQLKAIATKSLGYNYKLEVR